MTVKTEKRKSPTESATKYKIGTTKLGNDGNMWVIISTQSGTHRWKKIASNTTKKSTTNKKTRQTSNRESKTKDKEKNISLEQLKQLKKKYSVSTNGSKKEHCIFRVCFLFLVMDHTSITLLVKVKQNVQQLQRMDHR